MSDPKPMKPIPMLDLKREYEYMKADIDAAIQRCLDHQKWILGPEVAELEDRIAKYLNVKHAIGTSSGTDALVLALRALAIRLIGGEYFEKSDQIITTPFTFTATGDAILRAGATPLFVDIDPITYNIDPAQVRKVVESKPRKQRYGIRGILPVHLYGQSCQMDEIAVIASEFNLSVIEDCAQAFGASWNGQRTGSLGTCGAFSFFLSKNLGGFGDAGMVSTNDDEIAELVRMLLKHGGRDKYNVDHIGYNARLDTLQAAILVAKLPHIDEFNKRRGHIASLYKKGLKDIEDIELPTSIGLANHVYHQFTIRVLNDRRAGLQKHLHELGIDSMVYYPVALHKMKLFQEGRSERYGDLAAAVAAAESVLSLPIEPLYGEVEVNAVIQAIKKYSR